MEKQEIEEELKEIKKILKEIESMVTIMFRKVKIE